MKQHLQKITCLVMGLFFILPTHAQFVNFEDTWKEFLAKDKVSKISDMPKPKKSEAIDYVRYCLMYANTYFCAGNISSAEDMLAEVKKMGATSYESIPGFKEKNDDLTTKVKAYHQVENHWARFLKYKEVDIEAIQKIEKAGEVCEKGTLAKYSYMMAYDFYCKGDLAKAKNIFENRVLKLAERTSLKVSDIKGLEAEVKKMKTLFAGLKKLGVAWKEYTSTGNSPGFDTELPLYECYPIPSLKEYVLRGAADVCGQGNAMVEKIQALQESNPHSLDATLQEKIKWLETEVGKNNGDIANLNKAWAEFVPQDTLTSGIQFGFEYCSKAAEVKAWVMEGTIHACTKGKEILKTIATIQSEHNPNLDGVTLEKITNLKNKIKKYDDDFATLEKLWGEFVENSDTLYGAIPLVEFYCDKIAQVKSWTIRGHFDACDFGQNYLDRIDGLQKSASLTFDEELECRVLRLRQKVWDCRYWELVLQARKETHEERERFGPASALIMKGDLNSDKLPCETGVRYEPLGNIGIKYVISTYLCQDIDLAKMGDPEYYKKIATWVDTEVLQKYCEEGLRCKEDFFIYLEGHTDGHAFRGARYKNSLDIPEGTPYTHFLDGEALEKTTEREITTSLKNNMELGIARAWTVKNQLDFMGVPITIGAWEHPESEKGGEFRKIEIELNITNLLLDFYEKRLTELLIESGIGERPGDC